MILKVKKENFIIYACCLISGIILILLSIFSNFLKIPNKLNNIFLSIGCSTIPTILVAYLIDKASEVRDADKKKELRDSFLWGMPYGLLWIAKTIVEKYYPFENAKDISFIDCFDAAIVKMKTIKLNDDNFTKYQLERNDLMSQLDYGISLCIRDCKAILEHDYELQINSVFSKEELIHIRYLFERCEKIRKSYIIAETAEYIELFIHKIYDSITEIKVMLDRKIIIENKQVENWIEITK